VSDIPVPANAAKGVAVPKFTGAWAPAAGLTASPPVIAIAAMTANAIALANQRRTERP
jgi:hypothetical protein